MRVLSVFPKRKKAFAMPNLPKVPRELKKTSYSRFLTFCEGNWKTQILCNNCMKVLLTCETKIFIRVYNTCISLLMHSGDIIFFKTCTYSCYNYNVNYLIKSYISWWFIITYYYIVIIITHLFYLRNKLNKNSKYFILFLIWY